MAKAELKARPHHILPGQTVFEVWYDGIMVGEVFGADTAGIRFVSPHHMRVTKSAGPPAVPFTVVDITLTIGFHADDN